MNTPTLTPDFYISVSTNPPKITGIGKTCGDSMEKLEVGLGPMVNTRELSHLKGKIGRILGKPIIPESQLPDRDDLDSSLKMVLKEQAEEARKKRYDQYTGLASILPEDQFGTGKKTKRRRNKRRKTKRRKTKRSKK